MIQDSISGILLSDGTEKMFPNYDITLWYHGNFGIAIKDQKFYFINESGKKVFDEMYQEAFPFFNGYAAANKMASGITLMTKE